MPARLHLIDGTFELYRAHLSKRPDLRSPEGVDVKATVGVVSSLLSLLHDESEAVTHLAVAFDNPIRSFRNDLFDGYKSDLGVPPELRAQFDLVERAVAAIGVVVWSMDRFEADDALATGAARYGAEFDQVRIYTPDKDLGQCLDGQRVVQVDVIRKRVIDEAAMRARRGIAPASIPDYLALVGDVADGIPGVPGIGEKTAAALLAAYGHLEAIPKDPALWSVKVRGADAIAASLSAMQREAILYRTLATLVRDVPLRETTRDLEFAGVPREAFTRWCSEIGAPDSVRARGLSEKDA